MRYRLFLACCLLCTCVFGQSSWQWAENGQTSPGCSGWNKGVAADAAGNVIQCGEYTSAISFGPSTFTSWSNRSIFVVKYDGAGNLQWAVSSGASYSQCGQYCTAIAASPSGKVYVTGYFSGYDMIFADDTLYEQAGVTQTCFVAAFDANGAPLWAHAYEAAESAGTGIACDPSGNVFVSGTYGGQQLDLTTLTLNSSSPTNVFLAKLDTLNGDGVWGKFGTSGNKGGDPVIACDPSGNIDVGGYFNGQTFQFGNMTMSSTSNSLFITLYVIQFDPAGNGVWKRMSSANWRNELRSIAAGPNGDVIVTGCFATKSTLPYFSFEGDTIYGSPTNLSKRTDFFLAGFSASGTPLWIRSGGGCHYDYGHSVSVSPAGEIFLTIGYSNPSIDSVFYMGDTILPPSGFTHQSILMKLNAIGYLLCYETPDAMGVYYTSVAALPSGDVAYTGDCGNWYVEFGSDSLYSQGVFPFATRWQCTSPKWAPVEENETSITGGSIFPNPVTNVAVLRFSLAVNSEIRIVIYDAQGKITEVLFSGELAPGEHEFQYNMESLAAGMYTCFIESPENVSRLRLIKVGEY